MKRLILVIVILLFATSIGEAQQRWKVSYGTTGTIVDTVTFGIPYWSFYVENQGNAGDTLYVWQVGGTPTAQDKCILTAGRGEYFISSAPNYYIYLQSNGNVKRYIKIFY